MTDATPQPTQPDPNKPDFVLDVGADDMLQLLASLVQRTNVEIGLTLAVSGTVISGLLIGRNAWLELQAQRGAEIGGSAQMFMGQLQEAFATPINDEADMLHQYGFLHLKDVSIQFGTTMSDRGMLWRVRISEVSAWTFEVLRSN